MLSPQTPNDPRPLIHGYGIDKRKYRIMCVRELLSWIGENRGICSYVLQINCYHDEGFAKDIFFMGDLYWVQSCSYHECKR